MNVVQKILNVMYELRQQKSVLFRQIYTDSAFYNSWFYRFLILRFWHLQIPDFPIPDITNPGFLTGTAEEGGPGGLAPPAPIIFL